MPTFQFTDQPGRDARRGLRGGRQRARSSTRAQFVTPSAQNVAIGREVFNMLRCQQCHALTQVDPANPPIPERRRHAVARAEPHALEDPPAPRLDRGLDPPSRRDDPRHAHADELPARSARRAGSSRRWRMAIDSPQFAAQKAALLPYFQDEAALKKTMGDAVALTNYMRDYIWSIGIDRMRSAGAERRPRRQRVPQQPQPTDAAGARDRWRRACARDQRRNDVSQEVPQSDVHAHARRRHRAAAGEGSRRRRRSSAKTIRRCRPRPRRTPRAARARRPLPRPRSPNAATVAGLVKFEGAAAEDAARCRWAPIRSAPRSTRRRCRTKKWSSARPASWPT